MTWRVAQYRNRRARRWADFRRRVDYSPQSVYRHQAHGWEYIPIHPFGDEPGGLARLGISPAECWGIDAWWGINGDATLLETVVRRMRPNGPWVSVGGWGRPPRSHQLAVLDAPFVTRVALEDAMERIAAAGYPDDPRFCLRQGDPRLVIAERPPT